MIVGFVGTPGSGKTYEAVKKIIANLKNGRRVYTNIDGLNLDEQREFIKVYLDLDDYELNKRLIFLDKAQVLRFWEIVKDGSLVVLDEIHKDFSNREWNTLKNKQFADWCSTHRHAGFDVVFITQDMQKVESHVRSLIEWTYVFRKVNFLGSAVSKKYICYSFAGDETTGNPLATSTRTYDTKIFNCYNSYVTKDAKEIGFMSHVNILKHPIFFIIPCVLAFFLYMFFTKSSFATGDLFGSKKVAHRSDKPAVVPSVAPSPVPFSTMPVQRPFSSVKAVVFSESDKALSRVVGFLNISKTDKRILLDDGRIIKTAKSFTVGQKWED